MTYSQDQRFSKEIKTARERFDVEHGNYPPWDSAISDPVGRFVIIDGGYAAYDYIDGREHLTLDGMGEIDGQSVHTAKVVA